VHTNLLTVTLGLTPRCDVFYFTNTKADLIHKFEINLSVYMRQRGFSVHAMYP
jgi:alpha-mannosidase